MIKSEADSPKLFSPLPTIAITIGVFLGSQIFAGILVSLIPLILRWDSARVNIWTENNIWLSFSFVVISEVITLGVLYQILKFRGLSFKNIGINKLQLKHIAYTLTGFAIYFVLYILGIVIIKAIFPQLDLDKKQEIGFDTNTRGLALLPAFISLVILVPITEEIITRGFLYGGLRTKLPVFIAAGITSLFFAVAHLGEASEGLLWVAAIDTFILSIVLCYLREKTNSLWPSIGVHMIKNFIAFIIIFKIVNYFR